MHVIWIPAFLAGVALIVWGAEAFAEHLGVASVRLGVSAFALALLLAGAEPEELATVVVAALRGSPGIALGDVIGANVAICLVALGVGAVMAPLPFPADVMRYAALGLPLGAMAAWLAWDGTVSRIDGAVLVALYVIYVGVIWIVERRPPALGEVHELEEARQRAQKGGQRVGRELLMVFAGLTAMAGGAALLVEAVRRLANVEATQTVLGLTLVGFATAFELVVLVVSRAARRLRGGGGGRGGLVRLQCHHDAGRRCIGEPVVDRGRPRAARAVARHAGGARPGRGLGGAQGPARSHGRHGAAGGISGIRGCRAACVSGQHERPVVGW